MYLKFLIFSLNIKAKSQSIKNLKYNNNKLIIIINKYINNNKKMKTKLKITTIKMIRMNNKLEVKRWVRIW